MATKMSIVALFDDIVASTNILVAGTEGSELYPWCAVHVTYMYGVWQHMYM